jgi:hypothetical protein
VERNAGGGARIKLTIVFPTRHLRVASQASFLGQRETPELGCAGDRTARALIFPHAVAVGVAITRRFPPTQSFPRQGPATQSAASHESCVVHAFGEREDTANGIDFEESAKGACSANNQDAARPSRCRGLRDHTHQAVCGAA